MTLSTDLAKIATRNKQKLLKVAQNSLMRVGGRIVAMSPVDTGRFRANWLSAYGALNPAFNENIFDQSGSSLGNLKTALNGLSAGQVFYFTNSLPYAQRLEYGWSAQAPAGMVRLSVANWQTIVAEEVKRVK